MGKFGWLCLVKFTLRVLSFLVECLAVNVSLLNLRFVGPAIQRLRRLMPLSVFLLVHQEGIPPPVRLEFVEGRLSSRASSGLAWLRNAILAFGIQKSIIRGDLKERNVYGRVNDSQKAQESEIDHGRPPALRNECVGDGICRDW